MEANKDGYFVDAENAGEMARLIKQSQMITQATGLFPTGLLDEKQQLRLLDIGSGPGEWALTVAEQYPAWDVWGVDISHLMTEYAEWMASENKLYNTHFQIMDAKAGLLYSENYFDVVHMRFTSSFQTPQSWPGMLTEVYRVLKPGGLVIVAEADFLAITNGAALARLTHLMALFGRMRGQQFAREGDFSGTTAVLHRLLKEAGFQDQRSLANVYHAGYGEPGHDASVIAWKSLIRLLEKAVVATGLASEEEMARLFEDLSEEVEAPDFGALGLMVTFLGKKLL